jgi:two-component system cell cycle response regulator
MTPPPGQARSPGRSLPPGRWREARPKRPPARADAFDDHRPTPRPPAKMTIPVSAAAVIVVAHLVIAGAAALLHPVLLVGQLALAVVSGAWLDRRRHRRAQAVGAVAAALAAGSASLDVVAAIAIGAAVAVVVVGFGALPRLVVSSAIRAARRAEQERADGEVLRLVDDARRLRALGGRHDGSSDEDGVRRDIGGAVTQRDRLYRLLGLVERGVGDVDGVALYALDASGTALTLIEQRHRFADDGSDVDIENHPRLALGSRGVGPAGLLGLSVQRKGPLRVVDVEGNTVCAHRKTGPAPRSALCVPLLSSRGTATGVIVVDRVAPAPFSAADEAFVRALAAEVQDGLAMETLIEDLDAERRRIDRVFAAARALAGVARRADVQRVATDALAELCAGAAIVDVTDGSGDRRFAVAAAFGVLEPLAGVSDRLEPTSFAARALDEGVPLPHVSLDKASPRPLLASDEALGPAAVGDLRAIPLLVAGAANGVLIVAARPGERLRQGMVDAVVAIADVLALALSSANAFDVVEKKATTDGLTGVWNRRTLDEKTAEAVARCRRSGGPLCVIMTDVDHFKSVNDTWGHATGDEVLKGVARSLQQGARTTDIVGRLGGEEFVVVCEATDLAGAAIVAERMRQALKALAFHTPKGPLSITSSFGVALLLPDDTDGHSTLEAADKNLYKAKQAGRDRVVAA